MQKAMILFASLLLIAPFASAQPVIDIDVIPSAITVPAQGGWFEITVSIQNTTADSVSFDAWLIATTPFGFDITLVFPVEITVPGGFQANADLWLWMPWFAPSGDYVITGYVGDYPETIIDSASLTVTKEGFGGDLASIEGIRVVGDFSPVAFGLPEAQLAPEKHSLPQAYPNPFNPTTTIGFSLPDAANVSLNVYDTSGRLVKNLIDGWSEAGTHAVAFDGSNLASGVYIYRLQTAGWTASGALILAK